MNVKIKKELAFRRIAGEVFIVDAAKAEMHELNGTAALIWEGLAAGETEKVIVSALISEFEIEEKTARADFADFVEELEKAGLLASV
ncbi:MAG: hypothetical protein A3J70_05905 [Elusimicrobia bacterium RIFCSPHIGHO2_02_FULL_61_10]|nr:MAG: hypothetical protein A3J70_05905 [Elusimicrobia bacterium RIFCSPHIGHO2_02_FULL_61_10]